MTSSPTAAELLALLPVAARDAYRRAAGSPVTQLGEIARFRARGGSCASCADAGVVGRAPDDDAPIFCACATGLMRADEWAQAEALRAGRAREERFRALARDAGLAPYRLRDLATWPGATRPGGQAVVAALEAWEGTWPAKGRALVLHGTTGNGKTSLAAALLKRRIARTLEAGHMISVTEMIQKARPGDHEDKGIIHRARHAPAVVLDDLGIVASSGREPLTPFVQERLFYLIDGRVTDGLWTVYTTNEDPDAGLRVYLGERLYWRVRRPSLFIKPGDENFRDR